MAQINYSILFFGCLCVLIFLLIALGIMVVVKSRKNNILNKYLNVKKEGLIDKILDKIKFINELEERNKLKLDLIGSKISARSFTKTLFLLVFIIGVGLTSIIGNILALPFLLIICYLLPNIVLDLITKRKKLKMEEQLGVAIRFFKTEYITTKSIPISIQNIIPKLSNPIKKEFEKLLREILTGRIEDAFNNFARRLDNKFAYVFAKLIISQSSKGAEFGEYLITVSEDITEEQTFYKENLTELAMSRFVNIALNVVLLLSVFLVYVIPGVKVFFTSQKGQAVVLFAIISSFVSILLGFKLSYKLGKKE